MSSPSGSSRDARAHREHGPWTRALLEAIGVVMALLGMTLAYRAGFEHAASLEPEELQRRLSQAQLQAAAARFEAERCWAAVGDEIRDRR